MNHQELYIEFAKKFNFHEELSGPRSIGIELEIPVVIAKGNTVDISTIQEMFEFLERKGFQLKRDDFSGYIESAFRVAAKSLKSYNYHLDTITTDAGSSILEIILAPRENLHIIQQSLMELIELLCTYFDTKNCKMLGYGIQPITPPSRKLLMPKERYFFYEEFSQNNVISKSEGVDAHLLTVTASNQCHISVGKKEAVLAANVLNSLSGLQIILNANSPIWMGKVDAEYKANREIFWQYCYPNRLNQLGIPPRFQTMKDYVMYLLKFKPMLIKRAKLMQILNKSTFEEFMLNKTPAICQTLKGEKFIVQPKVEDIHYLNTFCYFDARLVPKYGTIESRVSCQQPPGESLAPTALTLGILENLEEAKKIMGIYSLTAWRKIRKDAMRYTFKTSINGKSIIPLLTKFLDIAKKGLQKRNLGEDIFLKPLYERLERQKSPADEAIEVFKEYGVHGFLDYHSFTKNTTVHTPVESCTDVI